MCCAPVYCACCLTKCLQSRIRSRPNCSVLFVLSFSAFQGRLAGRAPPPRPLHLSRRGLSDLSLAAVEKQSSMCTPTSGTNSAEVAMLVHELGCPTWSFTVHGPEEFDKPHFIGLPEKIRRANFVVAVSSYGRSQIYRLVSHDIWPKIHVVRCGLDKRFLEALPSRSERLNPPRFACVGRLCEQKGQLLLLQAASRLKSKGVNFELMLVGDGEMRGELENIISNENLGDRVRITGWLDNQRVREVILASTALVLPSFAEGLPIVIMEAMALERPVISTYIAGIPELVTNDENGWLVPAGDLERLVDAMETCANASDTVLDTFGHTSRQRVVQAHDIDTEAQKLQGLFSGQCSRISQD